MKKLRWWETKQEIKHFFDSDSLKFEAERWGSRRPESQYDFKVTRDFLIRALAECYDSAPRHILDIGSGTGIWTRLVPSISDANQIYSLDISVQMLQRASDTNILQNSDSPRMVCADGEGFLPFPDNTFDAILCVHVLEYMYDWSSFFHEIARVLKPKGLAILVTKNREAILWWSFAKLLRLIAVDNLPTGQKGSRCDHLPEPRMSLTGCF